MNNKFIEGNFSQKKILEYKHYFYDFIKSVQEQNWEKVKNEYSYGVKKTKRSKVLLYAKYFATSEEIYKYTDAKDKIATKCREKMYTPSAYQKNCMDYVYVQDLLKLLLFNKEELYKYYTNKRINPNILKDYFNKYINNGNIHEREIELLLIKLNEYIEYSKKQNKLQAKNDRFEKSLVFKEKVLSETAKLLEDIINSKHSLKVYSDLNNIDHKVLTRQLNRVKKAAPEEYEEFIKIVDENAIKESKENLVLAIIMNDMIINGVEENGYTRPFDIIDYYETTKIGIDAFIKSVKITLTDEKKILQLKVLLGDSLELSRQLFKMDQEVNSKKVIPINNEEIVIGQKENTEFINYLQSKEIPLNQSTFKALQKRYINDHKNQKIKSI